MCARRVRALFVGVFVLLLLPRSAAAIYIRSDVALANYQALAADPLYAATGYLRSANGQFCTATLVSPTTVLSGAHCFVYQSGPKAGTLALPSDVMFGLGETIEPFASNISALTLNPLFDIHNFDPTYDQALLTLSTPINSVVPALLYTGDPLGLIATMVGYGAQGTGVSNGLPGAGPRLAAQNIIDVVSSILQYDFDSPSGNTNKMGSAFPLPLEGTTASGDSGGPLFVTLNGTPFLVGTLFGGVGNNFYGDISYYARIGRTENQSFLQANGLSLISSVPEPATLTLLGAGLISLGLRRRGRRKTG